MHKKSTKIQKKIVKSKNAKQCKSLVKITKKIKNRLTFSTNLRYNRYTCYFMENNL